MSEPATFERLVLKNASVYHYMKICLIWESDERRLSAAEFKQMVVSAMKDLYGEVGAAFPFDVLKFEEVAFTAVLRVYSSGLAKLWSALTLLGTYHSQPCAVRVLQVTPFLLALSGNSRELELN
ncbi:hypothetical protein GJAV_G00174520 [Gymnothorax javanicus]|nr:hypothetical protein GJAV_G00174520 [Gymnothorax javanicus]